MCDESNSLPNNEQQLTLNMLLPNIDFEVVRIVPGFQDVGIVNPTGQRKVVVACTQFNAQMPNTQILAALYAQDSGINILNALHPNEPLLTYENLSLLETSIDPYMGQLLTQAWKKRHFNTTRIVVLPPQFQSILAGLPGSLYTNLQLFFGDQGREYAIKALHQGVI
jgi:hypothetical protein